MHSPETTRTTLPLYPSNETTFFCWHFDTVSSETAKDYIDTSSTSLAQKKHNNINNKRGRAVQGSARNTL